MNISYLVSMKRAFRGLWGYIRLNRLENTVLEDLKWWDEFQYRSKNKCIKGPRSAYFAFRKVGWHSASVMEHP